LSVEKEMVSFNEQAQLLREIVVELSAFERSKIGQRELFLAEAVIFRLYRIYERLSRSAFLHFCVTDRTMLGAPVKSKLKCPNWDIAEDILKSGNRFLDWGNVISTQKMSGLIFEEGFPIKDMLSPIHSNLVDLQRFRNFVAHESTEAEAGFKKSRPQYIKIGDILPETVGRLALYRKSARSDNSLTILHQKVASLSGILAAL